MLPSMTDKHVSLAVSEMAKYGPCTKALLSTAHNSLVCLLAGWFMAMKSWQWEERESLAKVLSYSLQMAWKEGLVSS